MKIMTWKYKIVPIVLAKDPDALTTAMNLMGNIGWELVGVTTITAINAEVAIFKRPSGYVEK